MNGKRSTIVPAFADTSLVVYAFAKDDAKIAVAEGILEQQPTISVQVISEFLNVCSFPGHLRLRGHHVRRTARLGVVHLKPNAFCSTPPGVRHEVRNNSKTEEAVFFFVHAPFEGNEFVSVEFRNGAIQAREET